MPAHPIRKGRLIGSIAEAGAKLTSGAVGSDPADGDRRGARERGGGVGGERVPDRRRALLGLDSDDPVGFLHPTAAGQEEYRDAVLAARAN